MLQTERFFPFIFNLKNGTFQSLVQYKLSYDSAKKITSCITGTTPDKSRGDPEAFPTKPSLADLV